MSSPNGQKIKHKAVKFEIMPSHCCSFFGQLIDARHHVHQQRLSVETRNIMPFKSKSNEEILIFFSTNIHILQNVLT